MKDIKDKLSRLKELKELDLITNDEYSKKRKALLDSLDQELFTLEEENIDPKVKKTNQFSFGWFIVGFLIPIIALFQYFDWKKNRPEDAESIALGGILGFLINFLIIVSIT